MRRRRFFLAGALAAACAAGLGHAADPDPAADPVVAAPVVVVPLPGEPVAGEQFDALHDLLKPQPGESKWAQIPWLTNLQEARDRAVAEGKAIFVWRAGGGEVLGRA